MATQPQIRKLLDALVEAADEIEKPEEVRALILRTFRADAPAILSAPLSDVLKLTISDVIDLAARIENEKRRQELQETIDRQAAPPAPRTRGKRSE